MMLCDTPTLNRCLSHQVDLNETNEKRIIESPNLSSKYEVWEELGRGMHANVFRGKKVASNDFFALKITKFTRLKRKRDEHNQALLNEASILKNLDHQNIIKCYEAFECQLQIVVVIELIEGGELFHYLTLNETITEMECIHFARQILDGINYIHSKNIAHLDLKPENIMLKNFMDKELVIVDFSLSRVIKQNEKLKLMQGTVEFSAPEIFNYELIGLYTDMWAFGVILYIMLTGHSPFLADDEAQTKINICLVDVPYDIEQFKTISKHAVELIKVVLVKEGRLVFDFFIFTKITFRKRLTAQQAINHRWFRVANQLKSRSKSMIGTHGFRKFLSINARTKMPSIVHPRSNDEAFDQPYGQSFFKPIIFGNTTLTRTKSF
ncbi:Death-associated protein kinase 2 [Thelohanellus kitauei]|uniref:Death-associated protein kinase 2 n=1 Tax=Thelohanellus kitauei TaxID=669202 RepID=A0A0C2MEA1_THEKT|nr:Death-associated protein kinase 2 [Thelohanellus kitauei]